MSLLLTLIYGGLAFLKLAAGAPTQCKTRDVLPKPTGSYHVGRSVAELVDYSRNQIFAPDIEPVKLEISVFYPVVPQYPAISAAYFPPETARVEDINLSQTGVAIPSGTFEKLELQLASQKALDSLTKQDFCEHPLVLFMSAEDTTRLFYSQIAATVASLGFTVVTIDAPYDVDVVEYPDGSLVTINETVWNPNNTEAALAQTAYSAIQARVEDVSFVLDSLSNTTLAQSLVPNLGPSGLNTTHTAMFGHSLGGATAYSVLQADARVLGGLDMDGGLFGPGLLNGTDKPFMFMAHANNTRNTSDPLATWAQAWPNLRGWKRDIMVADTLHYDFSDYPVVFETLGIDLTPDEREILALGDLEGTRALRIVTTYVGAFLDFVLYGKCSALLDGPVDQFPEVTFEY